MQKLNITDQQAKEGNLALVIVMTHLAKLRYHGSDEALEALQAMPRIAQAIRQRNVENLKASPKQLRALLDHMQCDCGEDGCGVAFLRSIATAILEQSEPQPTSEAVERGHSPLSNVAPTMRAVRDFAEAIKSHQSAVAQSISLQAPVVEPRFWRNQTQGDPVPWDYDTLRMFVNEFAVYVGDQKAVVRVALYSDGFRLRLEWAGNCVDTNEAKRIFSRWWLVSRHSAMNEVAQTLLLAALTANEHETRERFTYNGIPVYRPHQPFDRLAEFTKCNEPELRAAKP